MPAASSSQTLPISTGQNKHEKTKKAANSTNMKGADFGKAIGIDRPANVRDKIKKWQQEIEADPGAESPASPTPPAVVSVAKPASSPNPPSTPRAKPVEEKASSKPAHTPVKPVDVPPEQPKGAKKPPAPVPVPMPVHNKLDNEVHVATAPKKRVVSDSHWRNKNSPPKDGGKQGSPKAAHSAWVRPVVRKVDSPEKVASPPPQPKPKPKAMPVVKRTREPRTRSQRKRRPSRPISEGRPTSSGVTSTKSADEGVAAPKSLPSPAEKTELVRVRRRSHTLTSPRGSLSADDLTHIGPASLRKSETSLSEDPSKVITVEYDEPSVVEAPRHSEVREKRRRSRRHDHSDISQETSPKEPASSSRRRSHRTSYQKEEEEPVRRSPEPVDPATPPQVSGNRLEAWLSSTPDPFVDAGSQRRRKSRASISTLELLPKAEKSDVTASTDSLSKPVDEAAERSIESRRRRRRRSPPLKEETKLDLDNVPPLSTPTELSDAPTSERETDLTPTQTLKRRGARRTQHSPTKNRIMSLPARELTDKEDDIASLAPSSSVDSNALEREETPLRAPFEGPAMRRLFPSTGKRLSTIASVETFAKTQLAPPSAVSVSDVTDTRIEQSSITKVPVSETGSQLETSTIVSRRSTRRRLASHADLISVLSIPKAGSKSIVSARSIRTNRSRLATATISDVMNELSSDESKYMRELRTLVDGVIPVLLSCVLSKSDSAVAAGLFSPSASSDPSNVTKPIVDMGVALERLKTLHKRIPKEDSDAFLSWAQSAQRVYSDYISSWRLGFQDVVVSLASADDDPFTPAKIVNGPDDGAPWDEGLPRNAEGYVVNGDGERVDVAYMLKRPLVRLKYLSKSIKGINHVKPSDRAEKMSTIFQDLVAFARKRSNDEHARLEDEAAARIDPTRARDPRSLAPLAGVRIDRSRCVRARDHFDMHLYHSSGQELNCRIEILLRDEANGTDGDVLLCEVDNTGRWLLLPPIQRSRISARNGDREGEIIVMIRGLHGDGIEWSEVMSLTIDDEQAGFDWVQMLGLNPIPPQISELKRELTLKKTPRPTSSHASSSLVSAATGSTPPHKSRTPSPHQIEIPIGEQANVTSSKRWSYNTPDRRASSRTVSPITPPSGEPSQAGRQSPPSPLAYAFVDDVLRTSSRPRSHTEADLDRTPRSLNEARRLSGRESPSSLKRTRAKRLSKNLTSTPTSRPARQIVLDDPEEEPKPPRRLSRRHRTEQPHSTASSSLPHSSKGYSVWLPTSSEVDHSDESDADDLSAEDEHEPPTRPQHHRRASSVPTMEMPTISRQRKSSQPTTPVQVEKSIEVPEPPASAPPKIEKTIEPIQEDMIAEDDDAPPVPPHRTRSPATPVTLKGSKTPVFTPTLSGLRAKRRSSSPLKHEYEPSTCTESSSDSGAEISEDEESITSESSEDDLEDDVPTPLMPIGQPKQLPKVSPPGSIYTIPNGTITPSQSASNTPYRAVPKASGKASRAIASIMAWSDAAGQWKNLHPGECSIIVIPGKIQVFEIKAAHSKAFLADGDEIIPTEGSAPLIAVELTPLVPLRKSTGIDIEIRSPPTSESRIKTGNYIMLRSRNTNECDQLYSMINQSRINNPTYIALQNARGPYGQSSWAEAMDRQNAARSNAGAQGGWFGGSLGRRSSYRKTSTRAASISAATESSVGTMNTALRSALGRFSFAKNGRFNIKGSTLGSRSANSFDTGSSGSRSGLSTPIGLDAGRAPGAPAGITNSKCRLYERETLKKWRDMGAARLTIMLPDPNTSNSAMRQGKGSPGARDPTQEKRILVVGKKEETLLDVTLSETCFERVARLGIAVSVWEDIVGADGSTGRAPITGGVSGARARVFMIQMKNERECAYSYSLLGKMRY